MQTANKKLYARDSWWWFSITYAALIGVCLMTLYKMIGYLDTPMIPLLAVEVLFVSLGAYIIMLSLRDE